MDAIAPYVFFWNEWVVFPTLLVAAGLAYWRFRKASLVVVAAGVALVLVGQGLGVAFPAPLHPGYMASLFVHVAGLISALGGFLWFVWKDYRWQKSAT
jgi:hypothetical protein